VLQVLFGTVVGPFVPRSPGIRAHSSCSYFLWSWACAVSTTAGCCSVSVSSSSTATASGTSLCGGFGSKVRGTHALVYSVMRSKLFGACHVFVLLSVIIHTWSHALCVTVALRSFSITRSSQRASQLAGRLILSVILSTPVILSCWPPVASQALDPTRICCLVRRSCHRQLAPLYFQQLVSVHPRHILFLSSGTGNHLLPVDASYYRLRTPMYV
jgi:hypothetical protein